MIRNLNRFLKIPDQETWSHLCQCRTADKGDVQVSHVDVNVNNDSLGKLFTWKISFYVGYNLSLTNLRCCWHVMTSKMVTNIIFKMTKLEKVQKVIIDETNIDHNDFNCHHNMMKIFKSWFTNRIILSFFFKLIFQI